MTVRFLFFAYMGKEGGRDLLDLVLIFLDQLFGGRAQEKKQCSHHPTLRTCVLGIDQSGSRPARSQPAALGVLFRFSDEGFSCRVGRMRNVCILQLGFGSAGFRRPVVLPGFLECLMMVVCRRFSTLGWL